MRAFAFRIELLEPVPADRLHHVHTSEQDRTIILRSLGDAIRSGLILFHPALGFRNFFRKPGDGILEYDKLPAAGKIDRFVEAPDQPLSVIGYPADV
jgi:hypothetical protein